MKHIDTAKSIQESQSAFLKMLPGWIIRVITKIVHEDEMNHIINTYFNTPGAEFPGKVLAHLNITLEISGKENLPDNGRCFFVANHPFGMLDGLAMAKIILEKYGACRIIGNDVLSMIPQMKPYVAKVNVFGVNSREGVLLLNQVYESEFPINNFPAGEVSRRYRKVIEDKEWQKSFISKSVSCKRDIVPIFFHGRNSRLFHGIYSVRKFFGLNLNIELSLLPHELFRRRNSTLKVTIGKPIPWTHFTTDFTALQWAQKLKEQTYELQFQK